MKKAIALLLVLGMMLTLSACGGGKAKAFSASKEAYTNITAAYDITSDFGSDIYEAWRMGIYDKDEILENGVEHLDSELNLSEDEIKNGVAYAINSVMGDDDWEAITAEDKETYRSIADTTFTIFEDNLFTYCVLIVTGAYTANGKTAEAQEALDKAKAQMKEMSEKYSDYEHYPNLKEYYTTTSSFFDFCQNPTGSFEQVKNTINDYKNNARNYKSDLDYIFEE